ncbi:MAG: creatininase family protein [Cypionkella sp.]
MSDRSHRLSQAPDNGRFHALSCIWTDRLAGLRDRVKDTLAERSLIYLPLGMIEWHCEHLPVGLDALTPHGLCLQAADQTGGLVCRGSIMAPVAAMALSPGR